MSSPSNSGGLVLLRGLRFVATLGLAIACGSLSVADDKNPFVSLSAGPPQFMGTALSEESYVKTEAKNLTRARLIWANTNYLKEKGLPTSDRTEPSQAKEFERQILEAFAWGIPSPGEDQSAFGQREKTFYADRYGGSALGYNWGSGRAASAGAIQIKGIGRTPLVGEDQGTSHSNGTVPAHEMREAIFGEVNQALPYGGNRILAIIDRGTDSITGHGEKHRDILIIREDVIRPAHFVETQFGRGPWKESDAHRTSQSQTYLERSLPVPKNAQNKPRPQRIQAGLIEYTRRLGEQYAAAFVLRLYHGATSLSNIQINGAFLDYGTQTAQPGYGNVYILEHIAPAGDTQQIKTELIGEFLKSIQSHNDLKTNRRLPSQEHLYEIFDEAYQSGLDRGFLRLTGVPEELLSRVEKTSEAVALTRTLQAIAAFGSKKVLARHEVPEKVTLFDLNQILVSLADASESGKTALENALKKELAGVEGERFSEALRNQYTKFMAVSRGFAAKEGISREELSLRMRKNARQLNERKPGIYRWNMMDRSLQLIQDYEKTNDPIPLREWIDSTIRESGNTKIPSAPRTKKWGCLADLWQRIRLSPSF